MIYYPNKFHQPPHVFLDNTNYFISIHTYEDLPLLNDQRKIELIKLLSELIEKYNYKLFAYAILENHYHLLLKVLNAKHLTDLFQNLHGSLSFKWNKEDNLEGKKNFQSYWDHCVRGEEDFWMDFNYIHQNPIKHGLVKNLDDLKNSKFCSYGQWLKDKGREWMNDVWVNYPITDYVIPND